MNISRLWGVRVYTKEEAVVMGKLEDKHYLSQTRIVKPCPYHKPMRRYGLWIIGSDGLIVQCGYCGNEEELGAWNGKRRKGKLEEVAFCDAVRTFLRGGYTLRAR